MDTLAPIVLFAYKRPRHTLQALESLAANPLAGRSHLTIFCDGPNDPDETSAVAEVRRAAGLRSWCGRVTIIERAHNLGLAQSIISGVGEIVEQHGSVIVLEDDLVVSSCFLDYMNAALRHFRDEEQVLQVSGYMFPLLLPESLRTCFLPMVSSWGWATWQRAWRHFDPNMAGYDRLAGDDNLQYRFDLEGTYPFFDMLCRQRAGLIDSWAIRWYLSFFQKLGLTLFPAQSFVRNQGWDGSGTHCPADDRFDTLLSERGVERFPEEPETTAAAYKALKRFFRRLDLMQPRPLLRRVLTRLKHLVFS